MTSELDLDEVLIDVTVHLYVEKKRIFNGGVLYKDSNPYLFLAFLYSI